MATYQLGFHGFGALGIVNATAPAGNRLAEDVARGISTKGARFRLLDAAPPASILLIADSAGGLLTQAGRGAVVAAGSPFGVAGQPVELDCRITLATNETPARELVCFVLGIGGARVGLAVPEPLRPGVKYRVIRAEAQDTAAALHDPIMAGMGILDQVGPDQVGPGQVGPGQAGHGAEPWSAVLGFTHGTLIETPDGPRLIEDLRPGDLVTTLDNGSQPLRWIGTRAVGVGEMRRHAPLRPIRFEIGALGNQRPLLVSPQHRMLLGDWRAQVYFGEDQVLVAAKALENDTTICTVVSKAGVVYCHLLFDRHEVIVSEGALSESFHPGEAGLGALDAAQRAEIAALFPHLPIERRRAAFPIVKPSEARALRI